MRKFVLYSRDASVLAHTLDALRAQAIECTGVDLARFDPRDIEKGEYHILLPSGDDDEGAEIDHADMTALREVFGVRLGIAGGEGTPAEQFAAAVVGAEPPEKAPAKPGRKPKSSRPADTE